MRILLVCEFFPKSQNCEIHGGVEGRTFFLAKYLVRLGHKVTVLATKEKNLPDFGSILNIKVIRAGVERDYSQGGSIAARISFVIQGPAAVKNLDFDLVDGQNFLGYLVAQKISQKKKIPVVATYNDVWVGEWIGNVGLTTGIFGEVAERLALKKKWAKFIAVSNLVREKLINAGIPSEKIVTVKCGIDWDEINKLLPVTQTETDIICVSRLVKYKKVTDLLLAVKKLKKPNIKIKIIGTGPERENLEKLTSELNLTKNVNFLGFIEKHMDVLSEIAKSRIFCLPSSLEGFGIVIVESLALGVPYVATKIPAIYEVTKEGRGGLLYKVGDVDSLSRKIESLLEDNQLYTKKLTQGTALAKKYDWAEIAQQTIRVYQGILGAKN